MKIIELDGFGTDWKNFLADNHHYIFHTYNYKKFVQEAFSVPYKFIVAVDNNDNNVTINNNNVIKAAIPIVEIKSRIFGHKIISSAYIEYGGFIGDASYFQPILGHLSDKYKDNFDYLEIRGGFAEKCLDQCKLIKKDLYKRFVLKLADESIIWSNIQKSKRKAIKKSLQETEVKEVNSLDINKLYGLYCQNMHSFGSPPYSKNYFVQFYNHLVNHNLAKVFGAYKGDKLIAALLGFTYLDRVHILIAVSDPKYQDCRPNDAVHWTFIRWAITNGYKYFDFGRVREESGQFEYKRKWGPELQQLPSYFLLWKAKNIPFTDPNSSRYKFMIKAWKKLPLSITKKIGMILRKGIGI